MGKALLFNDSAGHVSKVFIFSVLELFGLRESLDCVDWHHNCPGYDSSETACQQYFWNVAIILWSIPVKNTQNEFIACEVDAEKRHLAEHRRYKAFLEAFEAVLRVYFFSCVNRPVVNLVIVRNLIHVFWLNLDPRSQVLYWIDDEAAEEPAADTWEQQIQSWSRGEAKILLN